MYFDFHYSLMITFCLTLICFVILITDGSFFVAGGTCFVSVGSFFPVLVLDALFELLQVYIANFIG